MFDFFTNLLLRLKSVVVGSLTGIAVNAYLNLFPIPINPIFVHIIVKKRTALFQNDCVSQDCLIFGVDELLFHLLSSHPILAFRVRTM